MRYLRTFGQFWYDFVIGDDWKIAVSVVLSLAVTVGLLTTGVLGDPAVAVIGGVVTMVGFCLSMAVDIRGSRK